MARPCDINARGDKETTAINIEILWDTSKPLHNEPVYL